MAEGQISVFLADDNLLVREGVRALLNLEADLRVVGVAGDYDTLATQREGRTLIGRRPRDRELRPQVRPGGAEV
jgi:CBS domain-containing protein